jgi:hypothetical protein
MSGGKTGKSTRVTLEGIPNYVDAKPESSEFMLNSRFLLQEEVIHLKMKNNQNNFKQTT